MTGDPRQGPRPEVLARLAAGAAAPQVPRRRSARARLAGIALCAVTAGVVAGAIISVGGP